MATAKVRVELGEEERLRQAGLAPKKVSFFGGYPLVKLT